MKVINTEKVPIKLWLDDIEEEALEQARHLANLPFVFKHVAIMPDSHVGYGMPIGGVIATEGTVIPNAVGVDIGCGMCAVKTDITEISKDRLLKIMGKIREKVPLGFKHHDKEQDVTLMPLVYDRAYEDYDVLDQEYSSALHQIGTLGGGNHFIEIQKGSDGFVWIMIHSGSRNLGKKVADHYNKIAAWKNQLWCSVVPKEWQLAFLPLDTKEAKDYLREMNYCVGFALANRKLMMERIQLSFLESLNFGETVPAFEPMINIAHNYAAIENHFGKNVMVHRKGATLARDGTIGIIPGSQGTKSYIVKGKGNLQSFTSCSHGAGRRMGRQAAIRSLDLGKEKAMLDEQGIVHSIRHQNDLDEAAGAYKDIEMVMKNQEDLVDILVELSPLAVIKG